MNKTISPEELRARIDSDEKITLLDLRRQADFDAAPELIAGAEKLDPAKVEDWERTINPDKKVVIYCARGGAISQSVQQRLEQQGVDVSYVEGGFEAWKNSNR